MAERRRSTGAKADTTVRFRLGRRSRRGHSHKVVATMQKSWQPLVVYGHTVVHSVLKGQGEAVNLSQLASLGKVAGIGGIALGVVVLLVRPVIEQSATLPEATHGWLLLTIAVGAFALGVLGMVLWVLGNRSGAQIARTKGDASPARNIDRTQGGGRQDARTKGKRSPAINERGR
jgi:hypothetical protein